MNENLLGIFVCAFLGGGILIFLGAVMKYFNAGDMLNQFDERKYDKEKTSRVVGKGLLITGLIVLAFAMLSLFINERYYVVIVTAQTITILIGIAISMYKFYKNCRKQ